MRFLWQTNISCRSQPKVLLSGKEGSTGPLCSLKLSTLAADDFLNCKILLIDFACERFNVMMLQFALGRAWYYSE